MTDIIINYLWLLPLAIASMCNAVMDVTSFHYFTSIFYRYNFNAIFWNSSISWKNKYVDGWVSNGHKKINILGVEFNTIDAFTDSWHLFKSLMIVMQAIALMLAVMYYQPIYTYFEAIVLYGLVWNGTFNLFYNKILKKRV